MRLLPLVLLLSACSPAAPEPESGRRLYAGEGRDRLCMTGDQVGFIAFGEGDANCSVRGRLDRAENRLTLVPDGDADCRIEIEEQGDSLRLGTVTPHCAYYCGPRASFAGKVFTENASASAAVDFAGDPLC